MPYKCTASNEHKVSGLIVGCQRRSRDRGKQQNKTKQRRLHTTEMRMLRWVRGKTRLDHVRNVDIWKEAHIYPMTEFFREKRLRWLKHVQR